MKRYIGLFALALAVGILVFAVAAAPRLNAIHAAEKESAKDVVRQSVEVIQPKRDTLARSLEVPATIEALAQTDLYAKFGGYVAEVKVDIGDPVKAGQVLVVLSAPETESDLAQAKAQQEAKTAMVQTAEANRRAFEAAIKSAEATQKAAESRVRQAEQALLIARKQADRNRAELALKELTLARRDKLFKVNAVTEQDADDARMQAEVARAEMASGEARISAAEADLQYAKDARAAAGEQVETAKAQALAAAAQIENAKALLRVADADAQKAQTLLDYTQITAPFDGIVTRRNMEKGALAQPVSVARTMPILTVQHVATMRVFIEAPEVDISFITHDSLVKVKPFGGGATVAAKVKRFASSLNPNTRTMRVEIDIPNPDEKLMHGMYANVSLELDKRENALWIPATALLVEGSEKFVYVVEHEIAIRKPIVTGLDDGIRIEVKQGLNDGDWIVQTGRSLIAPNARVKAVPKQ